MQIFYSDKTIIVDIITGKLMEEISSLVDNLLMDSGNLNSLLASVVRSFLFFRESLLLLFQLC